MKQRKSGKDLPNSNNTKRCKQRKRKKKCIGTKRTVAFKNTLNKSHCITVNKAGKAYVMTTKELRVTENALFMKMPTKQH